MRLSISRLSIFSLLIALLGASAPVASVRAMTDPIHETAADVLEDCLEMIDELSEEVLTAMEVETQATVDQIIEMRADDATQKQLKKTAKRGKKDLSNIGRSGLAQLNRITGECMIQMRRLGSTRELNNTLLAARSAAFNAYKDAAKAGGELIDAGLAGEVGDDSPEEVPDDFQGTPL